PDNGLNDTYANDDAYNGNINDPIAGNVLDNDSDPEDDTQTVNTTPISGPENGDVTINPDGTFTYTPDANYTGPDSFVYEVCDSGSPMACDQATVILTVNPVNTTDAIPDFNNTYVNLAVSGNVLTNDEDAQGDMQTVTAFDGVSTPGGGVVSMNTNGIYIYTPDTGFVGTDTFAYTVCDDGTPVACDSTIVTIEVLADPNLDINEVIANDDTATTESGTPVDGNLIVNDFDPEGDNITINTTPVTVPDNGTVVINPDGTFTYTPNPEFVGEDTFIYEVCDDGTPQDCDQATVTITVDPLDLTDNDTYANDDAYNGDPNQPIIGNVLDNDTDPEGDAQTVSVVDTPDNGTLVLNPDGTFTFTPDLDFTGTDSFVYETCDDGTPEACDQATVIITINPVNSTDAIPDFNNTYVDTEVRGNVLTNDEDDEGDTQTVTTFDALSIEGGAVIVNNDGRYTYTPAPGFTGTDTFTYTICDDGTPVACDTTTVTIEVLSDPNLDINEVIANNDTATTESGTPVDGNLIVNDFDPEGDNIVINTIPVTVPDNGTVVINPDGTFTYTPNPEFVGEDTFIYEVCDDGTPQACDQATVTITVDPLDLTDNDTYANDDAYNGDPNEPITGNVLDNDTDPEGDAQTVTVVDAPDNGTLVLNPDGTFTYTPNEDSTGPDSFVYEVCDDGTPQACDQATVILTINPTNSTDAIPDFNNTFVNLAVSGNVLTNDEDTEGDMQTVTAFDGVSTPGGGVVSMNPDGVYIYTPATGFTGTDTFVYTVCDDGVPQACDSTIVTIEVLEDPNLDINEVIANDDTATTESGTPVNGNLIVNDFDPEGDNIVINTTPVTVPDNGTVVINPDGTFTYTPNPEFVGEDTFIYEVCDDGTPQDCDQATVTITVDPLDLTDNDTYANDDAYNGNPNRPIAGNVLDNDTDPEGDSQTVSVVDTPDNGTLVLNPDGTFIFTPNTDFIGTDSFIYEVCDDGTPQACDQATVILTINPANGTDAIPDFNNTYMNLAVMGNVLTNDEDVEGDMQTVTAFDGVSTPGGGVVSMNSNGIYIYTPATGFTGTDTFAYTVCDNGVPQACDATIVTIEVLADPSLDINEVIANNDTATTEAGTPVDGNLIVNDFDPEGDNIIINTTPVEVPTNGTVVINPDGTFTYTPNPGFVGEDTFTYEVCDDGTPQACDQATVTVTVDPLDPTDNDTYANDDAYNVNLNHPINGNVLDNDNDPEGDIQTVNTTPVDAPNNGTLVLNTDGTFTYTPNPGFTGDDSFIYEVCDSGTPQACDQATVVITVNPFNGTDAVPDFNNTYVDIAVRGNVLTNDEDTEGDIQAVTAFDASSAKGGVVQVNNDGSYIYTPPAGFTGTDTFTYTICDDGMPQACDTTTVTIEVLADPNLDINEVIANNDTATTESGVPVSGNLVVNDFDPEGDNLVINTIPVTDPTNGTLVINPDGTFTYTPFGGFEGEDTFTYEVCDDGDPQACDQATVTITVEPFDALDNDTYANDDAYNGDANEPIAGNVLDNDTDPEGDMQAVSVVDQPDNGALVLNPDGTFTFTPNPNFTGTDSFIYEVCDAGTPQACDQATVILTVNETLADLELTKVVSDDNYSPIFGDDITFDIEVTNYGPKTATGVEVLDLLPCGYEYVSHSVTSGVYTPETGMWIGLDNLALGDSQTLTITATVLDTCSDYNNIAEIMAADQSDPDSTVGNGILDEDDMDDVDVTPIERPSSCVVVNNIFTPHEVDGINDYLTIDCIEHFPDNTIEIYNRWGNKVYSAKGYLNTWDGISNGRVTIKKGEKVPVGTYYYVLKLGNGDKPLSGWLYVN
ncbi:Ig-like domain-containing protein, partial [Algibacter pacificus]|uniref:Ig-like domain-containing protein n=1 Tax=Algibacter pacificus TaxID=2599389 RepID=UPI0011CCD8EA